MKRAEITTIRCEGCGTAHPRKERCPSCDLYNAAVTAQNAAALEIARNYHPHARDAWLNEHGIFAWIDGVTVQVGSKEQAAPFTAMTSAARRVITFQPRPATERRDTDR